MVVYGIFTVESEGVRIFSAFTFAICCRLSHVRLSSVCLSSVTLMHPTQSVESSAIFLRHLVQWPSVDIHETFHGDRPRGTPSVRGVKHNRGSQI